MQEKKSESSFAQIKTKIKVVFLGEQSTGKTSILTRFIHDKFEEGSGPTVGIDFMAKNVSVGSNVLRLQLWDTAGQERFRSLIPSYLKDAHVAFVVFDLTNERSFVNLNQWIDLCQNNRKEKTIIIILGNKSDLNKEREVSAEIINQKIEQIAFPYFQVSAKSGSNIKEAFQFAAKEYFNLNVNNSDLNLSSFLNQKTHNKTTNLPTEVLKGVTDIPAEIKKQSNDVVLTNTTDKKKRKGCC